MWMQQAAAGAAASTGDPHVPPVLRERLHEPLTAAPVRSIGSCSTDANIPADDHARTILLVDVDCFYAQSEIVRHPGGCFSRLCHGACSHVFSHVGSQYVAFNPFLPRRFACYCHFRFTHAEYQGKPVAIQQKYIIVTCNYEARKFGLGKYGRSLLPAPARSSRVALFCHVLPCFALYCLITTHLRPIF